MIRLVHVGRPDEPDGVVLVVKRHVRRGGVTIRSLRPEDDIDRVSSRSRRARLPAVFVDAESIVDIEVQSEFLAADPTGGARQVLALVEPASRPEPLAAGGLVRPTSQQDGAVIVPHDDLDADLW